jgi:hypothetical protein
MRTSIVVAVANAIIWAAVILATSLVLRGTPQATQILIIIGGGAAASVIIVGAKLRDLDRHGA